MHNDDKDILQQPTEDIERIADLPTPAKAAANATNEPFSIYTPPQKKLMVLFAATAAFFSPVTATIYLPALNTIAEDLHVSYGKITLTVTTYLILQGIAPAFIGGFSDSAGRRPAYIICFSVYIVANIGLALQRNYVALLILRMLQSSGSSGTVAIANAVVADLVTSSERGSYIAYMSVTSILAPSVGPIVGGLLSQYAGWHWIFWFLVIFSVSFFTPFLLFMPETCRKIVGNGSIPPPTINQSLPTYLKEKRLKAAGDHSSFEKRDELARERNIGFPNPLAVIKIIFTKTAGLILLSTSLLFATYYAITAALPHEFQTRYGLTDLQVSFIYLPLGVGTTISAFTTGKLVDWNFRRHMKKAGLVVDKNRQDDLTDFPIERARIEVSAPLGLVSCVSVIVYGWLLEKNVSIAGPCIMLFIFGYGMSALFNCMNILMVDIYQGKPASATAANNLTRCLLGAASSAIVIPLDNAIGVGWTCTLAALIWGVFSFPLLMWLMRAGPRWRREAKYAKDLEIAKKEKAILNKDGVKAEMEFEKSVEQDIERREEEIAIEEAKAQERIPNE